jgi:dipeptidyl aminopeptidase/acylaminoacyl peptidase
MGFRPLKGSCLAAGLMAVALATSVGDAPPASTGQPLLTFAVGGAARGGVFIDGFGLCATDLQGHTFRISDPYEDRAPAWSPDSRSIAFRREQRYLQETSEHLQDIFIADAEGRIRRNLTRRVGRGAYSGAAWSPDGRELAFVSIPGPGGDLIVMKADGSGGRSLAGGQLFAGPVSWSPDGSRILFSLFSNGVPATYVIDRNGANLRRLLASAWGAVWSPDGSRLAYTASDGGQASLGVARADGSEARILSHGVVPGPPAWSPDGSMIAFVRQQGTSSRIVLIGADGAGEQMVATGSLPAVDPAWRPSAPLPTNRRPCLVQGTAARDVIRGTDRGDLVLAGPGEDTIDGAGGADVLMGDGGKDRLDGGPSADLVVGGTGDDVIQVSDRVADVIQGGPGRDKAFVDRLDKVIGVEVVVRPK